MSIKRIGSIKDYTPNFKIIIPRFDLATWHDYIEENFRNIDALFFNLFGINNYSGSWKQITEYKQGQVLFIGDDLDINDNVTDFSGRLVKVLVDHTTDNSDYFNIFYNLHPDYYELFADASTAQVYANLSKDWANKTDGTIITPQGIDTGEYSSKKYAQDAKNSLDVTNTYKEEAKNYATNAQNSSTLSQNQAIIATDSANFAKSSQTSAQISADLAKTYADSALIDANSSKISAELSKQYANDKINQTHITNCITEISQDIKLELVNGTLTLKAGSKVYAPNGAGVFDEVVIRADITIGDITTSGDYFLFTNMGGTGIAFRPVSNCHSGTSDSGTKGTNYYNTSTNIITSHNSGGDSQITFPFARVTFVAGTGVTSIDQVFNGFGYIGSTIFALPGVKGLIPDGRNADGSLKNIETTVNKVAVYTFGSNVNTPYNGRFLLNSSGGIFARVGGYDPVRNYITASDNKTPLSGCSFTEGCLVEAGVIKTFNSKLSFKAVDYNDFILNIQEIKNSLGIEVSYED